MKICIIHGSPRKGNTYKATTIFKEELKKHEYIEFTEFFLPKDMPYFCNGCFVCFEKGEDKCPHAQYVQPIATAIRNSDGLIFTSPVYVLGETAQIKALLDHFGYIYMPHRPMEEMFSKVAMVISTTAGAGTGHAIKTISRSLDYWGIRRVYKCGFNLYAKSWDDMTLETQNKFKNILTKKANRFYNSVKKRNQLPPRVFTKIMFIIMQRIISRYSDGYLDKQYWDEKGWMNGRNKPF